MNKKAIISWCFYDFATSAFSAVVVTFVFAAYFTAKIAPDHIVGTYLWGRMIAISGLFVAVLSPIMGAIADRGGKRKVWIFCLNCIGVIATACLWFAYPQETAVWHTLITVFFAFTALEIAFVFYNALLPDIAPEKYLGRISGWGWGLGYVGGLICLCICLFVFVSAKWLDQNTAENIRIIGPFLGLWIFVFSLPLFFKVPDSLEQKLSYQKAIQQTFKTLLTTIKSLRQQPNIALFLLAQMIYMDGLNTLFAFGGIYAEGTFNFSLQQVLILGILLNITAGIGATALAWLDDYIGSKKTILISLFCLILLGVVVLTIHSKTLFWIFTPFIGLFIGPSQSASRSLMARLAPAKSRTEMFGLYAFSGKATAFVGPYLVSTLTLLAASQRVGMTVIFGFFVVGSLLLLFVKTKTH